MSEFIGITIAVDSDDGLDGAKTEVSLKAEADPEAALQNMADEAVRRVLTSLSSTS